MRGCGKQTVGGAGGGGGLAAPPGESWACAAAPAGPAGNCGAQTLRVQMTVCFKSHCIGGAPSPFPPAPRGCSMTASDGDSSRGLVAVTQSLLPSAYVSGVTRGAGPHCTPALCAPHCSACMPARLFAPDRHTCVSFVGDRGPRDLPKAACCSGFSKNEAHWGDIG